MHWIDELDAQLSALREREAIIYYQADVNGTLNRDGLKLISEERSSLIESAQVASKTQFLMRESADPLTRRKAELLLLQIMLTRIQDAPELLSLRLELEQAEQAAVKQ